MDKLQDNDDDYKLYYKYKIGTNPLETKLSPMSPPNFYNLNKYNKFTQEVGHTYKEYISNWKIKNKIVDIDYISVVVKKGNKLYQTKLNKQDYINSNDQIKLPDGMISKGFYERVWDGDYYSLPYLS